MDLESVAVFISFSIGAIAMGIWGILGFYWWRKTRGALRTVLVWLSIYTVGTLGLRIYTQVYNYNTEAFDAFLTPVRMILNITVLTLGLYLARYSGKINREEEL